MQLMTDLHMFPIDLSDYAVLSEMEDIPSKKRYDGTPCFTITIIIIVIVIIVIITIIIIIITIVI